MSESAPAAQGLPILPLAWEVPVTFRRRLGTKVGRQRVMDSEGHLLLILHAPPMPSDVDREGRIFWLEPGGEWRATWHGDGVAALQAHVAEFAAYVRQLDESAEVATTSLQFFRLLKELGPLLRASRHLHQTLQKARKLQPNDRDLIDLRDQTYSIEREAELTYNDANNSLQCAIAERAEQQAHSAHRMSVSAHRLNIMAAIFFPIATLSGLFGVNLRHTWEEASAPWPFLILTSVGLLLGMILMLIMLRPPKDDANPE